MRSAQLGGHQVLRRVIAFAITDIILLLVVPVGLLRLFMDGSGSGRIQLNLWKQVG